VGDASRKPPRGAPGFPEAVISLNILDRGYILPLIGREEYTLGRVSKGQSILPDIDLSPFDAYKAGVSRLHATLKIQGEYITVTDLGSSNGTYINGKTIPAHEPQPLRHGDILALGKLKIQILFGQTR
jgi:pSer/pThr/pTyr-binding forkhead associated (FHA) protein